MTKRVVTVAGTGKAGFKDGKVMVAQVWSSLPQILYVG